MRWSLAHKLFAGFALLSLLTVLLGAASLTVIAGLAESQRNIGLLQELALRLNTLTAATAAQNNISFSPAISPTDFQADLDGIRVMAEKIAKSRPCARTRPEESDSCPAIMQELRDSYPQAAIGHYEKTIATLRLITKNRDTYNGMQAAAAQLPPNQDKLLATTIIDRLAILSHDLAEANSRETITLMQANRQGLRALHPGAKLMELAETFIADSEQLVLNQLDLRNRRQHLAETTSRFTSRAAAISRAIRQDSHARQQPLRAAIIFLSLCSVALTLLFWRLIARRLSRFLHDQKSAISSINSGNYDYQLRREPADELTELSVFTKNLAVNLKEEIARREDSHQDKKTLQSQLTQAQRLESVGLLAGGIAHDFNNILTGITGYTDLALARLEDNHPAKRYLEIIAQAGQKARDLTKQLQLFSRKQEPNKQVVNINTLIANLLKMLARMIGENIVLAFEPTADLPNVMADAAQLEQALLNMAVIAKGAMPDGGRLTIKTAAAALDKSTVGPLEGVDPGDFIRISITDTGTGPPEGGKEKVRDPFFATKDTHASAGLGRATVREIIKQHNGHVTVDRAGNRTTTFNLFLPVVTAEQAGHAQPAAAAPTIPRGHETILLVDDNDTAREFICETLEYYGYKLLTANSGNQAIKIMHQTNYPIDLLLTDIVMPGMNGRELAELARKDHPKIKVIFMSGYGDRPGGREPETLAPAGDFLKKPLSITTLTRKMREVLDS
jgi:signal transduction histidine kinase